MHFAGHSVLNVLFITATLSARHVPCIVLVLFAYCKALSSWRHFNWDTVYAIKLNTTEACSVKGQRSGHTHAIKLF